MVKTLRHWSLFDSLPRFGCRETRGRSELAGRMKSGGVQSMASWGFFEFMPKLDRFLSIMSPWDRDCKTFFAVSYGIIITEQISPEWNKFVKAQTLGNSNNVSESYLLFTAPSVRAKSFIVFVPGRRHSRRKATHSRRRSKRQSCQQIWASLWHVEREFLPHARCTAPQRPWSQTRPSVLR